MEREHGECNVQPLSYIELNGLRYAAGFVCKKLKDRIKSRSPKNSKLLLSMGELLEVSDEVSEVGNEMDVEIPVPLSCEWMNGIDRGGLLRVNDDTFCYFCSNGRCNTRVFLQE